MEPSKQLPGEVENQVVLPTEVVNPSLGRYPIHGSPQFDLAGEDSPKELLKYLNVLYRRKWLIVAASVFGFLLALLISFYMQPIYRSHTSLEIQGIPERLIRRARGEPMAGVK